MFNLKALGLQPTPLTGNVTNGFARMQYQ